MIPWESRCEGAGEERKLRCHCHCALLYPEYTEYDLQEAVTEYYRLFYGCDLTEELYQELLLDAMP